MVSMELYDGISPLSLLTELVPDDRHHGRRAAHFLASFITVVIYSVSQKSPLSFSDIFPKRLGIFSPNFTRLL